VLRGRKKRGWSGVTRRGEEVERGDWAEKKVLEVRLKGNIYSNKNVGGGGGEKKEGPWHRTLRRKVKADSLIDLIERIKDGEKITQNH